MVKSGEKGYVLEELLRAYFLRAGMFAVRGVPIQIDGEDLTDIDVWLYERPTGSSRRRQIVDAKSKIKPKAVERFFWAKGVYELLKVDGAYVATTDTRPLLKEISSRLGISVLDGTDLKRIAESEKVFFLERLPEEDLDSKIKAVDKGRRNKEFQTCYRDLKAALIDQFGAGSVNRALEHFHIFSHKLITSYPSSASAEVALRLAYVAASIIALTLDYAIAKVSFKSAEDRRKAILNVIRYGNEDYASGTEKIRVAAALIERYSPNGRAVSQAMLNSIQEDFEKIPAEIIADHILAQVKGDGLFRLARSLEFEGFRKQLRGFDDLTLEEKAFLGVILDFIGVERSKFANAWKVVTSEAFLSDGITSKKIE